MRGQSVVLASASGMCGAVGAAALKAASDSHVIWRLASYVMYISVSRPLPTCLHTVIGSLHHRMLASNETAQKHAAGQHRRVADVHRRPPRAAGRDCCCGFALQQYAHISARPSGLSSERHSGALQP